MDIIILCCLHLQNWWQTQHVLILKLSTKNNEKIIKTIFHKPRIFTGIRVWFLMSLTTTVWLKTLLLWVWCIMFTHFSTQLNQWWNGAHSPQVSCLMNKNILLSSNIFVRCMNEYRIINHQIQVNQFGVQHSILL